jgi:hypothetical protein
MKETRKAEGGGSKNTGVGTFKQKLGYYEGCVHCAKKGERALWRHRLRDMRQGASPKVRSSVKTTEMPSPYSVEHTGYSPWSVCSRGARQVRSLWPLEGACWLVVWVVLVVGGER